jgi:hypothetical protein
MSSPDSRRLVEGLALHRIPKITKFLKNDRSGIEKADYATSLLILRQIDGWRFGAFLNVSPDIDTLPMIMRTGDAAPWMSGEALGLSKTWIFEPLLQRVGSRHICYRAAREDQQEFETSLGRKYGDLRKDSDRTYFEKQKNLIAGRVPDKREEIKEYIEGLWGEISEQRELYISGGPGPDVSEKVASLYDLMYAAALAYSRQGERHLCLPIGFFGKNMKNEEKEKAENDVEKEPKEYKDKIEKEAENVVIQGVGDLSMNPWNVAFFDGKLFSPPGEPLLSRYYPCFIKWKTGRLSKEIEHKVRENDRGMLLGDSLAIARLRPSPGNKLSIEGFPLTDGIEDAVELAVYGKPVLWGGRVLKPEEVVEQFADVRHVFSLPNLRVMPALRPTDGRDQLARGNGLDDVVEKFKGLYEDDPGKKRLSGAEKFLIENFETLKRYRDGLDSFFGLPVDGDCWLLERELLRAGRNFRENACQGPIVAKLADLGAPKIWIHYCLLAAGYEPRSRPQDVRSHGEFSWDEVAGMPDLRIFLKRATYPCTLIGIGRFEDQPSSPPPDKQATGADGGVTAGGGGAGSEAAPKSAEQDGNALYMLAWGHDFKYASHSIWDCAEVLRAAGARYALCMDEGQDVFQCFIPNIEEVKKFREAEAERSGEPLEQWMKVPIASDGRTLSRRALRASLAVWQERPPDSEPTEKLPRAG